jgi:hypothetical protein
MLKNQNNKSHEAYDWLLEMVIFSITFSIMAANPASIALCTLGCFKLYNKVRN